MSHINRVDLPVRVVAAPFEVHQSGEQPHQRGKKLHLRSLDSLRVGLIVFVGLLFDSELWTHQASVCLLARSLAEYFASAGGRRVSALLAPYRSQTVGYEIPTRNRGGDDAAYLARPLRLPMREELQLSLSGSVPANAL